MTTNPENQWPSVDLAFELVKPSYDWMLARIESIHSDIQHTLTLATTITAAVPLLAQAISSDVDFRSPWFLGLGAAYLATAILAIHGLSTGSVQLIHPRVVFEKWLSNSPWEFKKNAIHFAGEDFDSNNDLVNKLAKVRTRTNWLIVGELLAAIVWMASAA